MNNLKVEHRSVIKFLIKKGSSPKIILERMKAMYLERIPSYFQVKYWREQFKWGRDSSRDKLKSERSFETRTEELINSLTKLRFSG